MLRFIALAAIAFALSCAGIAHSLVSAQLAAEHAVLSVMGKS
jgi:hypothetical protein